MLSIRKEIAFILIVFLFEFSFTSKSHSQTTFNHKIPNYSINNFSSDQLILIALNDTNQDSSNLSSEERIKLYKKEKKSSGLAMFLNTISGPLVLGHYYAGEPQMAIPWHAGWIIGAGSAALAIEKQSDFWGYLGAGVLAYTFAYQIIEAGAIVDAHNMKLLKKYDMVINFQNKNSFEAKILLSYHF